MEREAPPAAASPAVTCSGFLYACAQHASGVPNLYRATFEGAIEAASVTTQTSLHIVKNLARLFDCMMSSFPDLTPLCQFHLYSLVQLPPIVAMHDSLGLSDLPFRLRAIMIYAKNSSEEGKRLIPRASARQRTAFNSEVHALLKGHSYTTRDLDVIWFVYGLSRVKAIANRVKSIARDASQQQIVREIAAWSYDSVFANPGGSSLPSASDSEKGSSATANPGRDSPKSSGD